MSAPPYELGDNPGDNPYTGSPSIEIHSRGGACLDFLAVFEEAKKAGARGHIKGLACGSAVAFLGLGKVSITQPGYLGFSETTVSGNGSSKELERLSRLANSAGQALAEIVAQAAQNRPGGAEVTVETVRGWMAAERWFDSQEALALGLVDEVTDETDGGP